MSRRKPRNLDELEEMAEIRRTTPRAPTQKDVEHLERKILGRTWGKPRRKLEGWPK